jgi:two-component system response regulator AtoC
MKVSKATAIVVVGDDDAAVTNSLEAVFGGSYRIDLVDDADDALTYLRNNSPVGAVLVKVGQVPERAMELVGKIRSLDKDLPVVMMSESPSPDQVVSAMKMGASDFLVMPLRTEAVRTALEDAWKRRSPMRRKPPAREEDQPQNDQRSPCMRQLYSMAASIAPSDTPVLIQGETGSGKEVLARHLHALSRRAHKPFLKLNCAALPSELVESELFGYERGAFTGAFQRKPGMFEVADGGTLLLDEIGDMEFKLQAKLLQVLQDHEFQRLGGKETVRVDVRVIAATHNDLEKSIANGKFRQDLYYRLNVVSLYVPPLRECREDILGLVDILLERHGCPEIEITPALQQAFLMYSWPGNVRELENMVRKLSVFRDPDLIARDLSARAARQQLSSTSSSETGQSKTVDISTPILEQVNRAKHQAETEAIMATLTSTQWNRKTAAALLKIDYKSFLYKMKKLGIEDRVAILPDSGNSDGPTKVMVAGSR